MSDQPRDELGRYESEEPAPEPEPAPAPEPQPAPAPEPAPEPEQGENVPQSNTEYGTRTDDGQVVVRHVDRLEPEEAKQPVQGGVQFAG